jgi:hypothetical protein
MTTQATNPNQDYLRREAAEDIFYGQVVINWARWFVIAAGVAMVMILTETPNELAIGIGPIVGLMVVNFYLHGRRLANQPANRNLIAVSSMLDLALITTVVGIGTNNSAIGLDSQFYVAYFPVIAAFSFVMPRKASMVYTLIAMGAYAAVCMTVNERVINGGGIEWIQMESVITRLIVMGAVGGLASYFWRVQRDRRRVVVE